MPANCSALGKVILALGPQQNIDEILRKVGRKARTQHTITRRTHLLAELARIRTRGYAIDDEELEEGLKCIAAPVQDYSGKVVAAISIAGPSFRLTRAALTSLIPYVAQIAAEFSQSLGFQAGSSISGNSSLLVR